MTELDATIANSIYSWVWSGTAPTPTGTRYLALFTSAWVECTGGSYARQAITMGAGTAGDGSNSAGINFANMPAATVTHWGLFSVVTAGTYMMRGTLVASKTVLAGQTLSIIAGDLDANVDAI